ncbi:hypothetical protein [Comamonas sp. 23]|uniref:hypothetical protein n=1 Tax=Comamonas sp. 23 TaxID=3415008 RepID=UPI003C704618
MANIPVKWAHSGMRGAPVINGVVGSLIGAIRTFLITGFAPTAAVSAAALDGIATIMLPSGQSFEEHGVVLLAGATTPGFNGEERVLTTASDRITVATTAANGPIAGSITVRYAPVGGWEEVFSKTNVSVFRSVDPTGNRMFLRVDDTNALFARVVGYESMTDVDTGTGAFPTAVQMPGGGYWHKSITANATAVRWKMVADSKFLLHAIAPYVGASSSDTTAAPARGFGDPLALSPSGDAWGCVLSVAGTSTASGPFTNGSFDACTTSSVTGGGAIYSPRALSGLGSAVISDPKSFAGGRTYSGSDGAMGALPSRVDGQIKFSTIYCAESDSVPRVVLPAIHYIPQSGALSVLADGDFLPGSGAMAGKRMFVVGTGPSTSSAAGRYLLDITGPNWRA